MTCIFRANLLYIPIESMSAAAVVAPVASTTIKDVLEAPSSLMACMLLVQTAMSSVCRMHRGRGGIKGIDPRPRTAVALMLMMACCIIIPELPRQSARTSKTLLSLYCTLHYTNVIIRIRLLHESDI